MEKNNQPLILGIVVIAAVLIIALALIFTRSDSETEAPDESDSEQITSQPNPDPQPTPQPQPGVLPFNWGSLTERERYELNPTGCDLYTQWIGDDGTCHAFIPCDAEIPSCGWPPIGLGSFVILREPNNPPPEYYDNLESMPCGGSEFSCNPQLEYKRVAVRGDLSEMQLDPIWRQYMLQDSEKIGRYTLIMEFYDFNGSNQLQDYVDKNQESIAEYRLPAYLELEFHTQGTSAQSSIAIVFEQSGSNLGRVANDIVVAYNSKITPLELTGLTIFAFDGGENIIHYSSGDIIWQMPPGE